MRFLRTASFICALLALLSAPAFSSVMTFTDEASWSAATASFSAASLTPGAYSSTTGMQIPGGPEFVGLYSGSLGSGDNLNVYNGSMGPYLTWDDLNPPYIANAWLEITFSAPVTSVGFNFYGGGNQPYNVTVNHGGSYSTTAAPAWPAGAFFGITSTTDAPISVLDISLPSGDGSTPAINNFDYGVVLSAQQPPPGDPQDTPEVCTFLMIGSGLFFVARLRRRIRPAATPQAI